MRNKIILIVSVFLIGMFFLIRNQRVYHFRMEVVGLILSYNEHHYFNQIHKLDQVVPSYYDMLFSIKPLKYEYWINGNNMKKLTEKDLGISI